MIVDNLEIRQPTLPEKLEIMEGLYNSCKENELDQIITRFNLSKLLVRLGLVKETETGIDIIDDRIPTNEKYIECSDFLRMFMKVVFKDSLVSLV